MQPSAVPGAPASDLYFRPVEILARYLVPSICGHVRRRKTRASNGRSKAAKALPCALSRGERKDKTPASRRLYKKTPPSRREAEAGISHFRGPEVYLRHSDARCCAQPFALSHPREIFAFHESRFTRHKSRLEGRNGQSIFNTRNS